jgi:hypothetical protein
MRRTTIIAVALAATLAGWASATEEQTTGACAPIVAQTPDLPTDPLQRVAQKAIRGDFGVIPAWKLNGYKAALATGATVQGRAWVTSYYPSEGFYEGKRTRSGIGVTMRSAAVQRADWKRFRGCWVWTAAYGIRLVEDTGANSNTRVARSKGADRWLDYWFPKARNGNPVTEYAFIRQSK